MIQLQKKSVLYISGIIFACLLLSVLVFFLFHKEPQGNELASEQQTQHTQESFRTECVTEEILETETELVTEVVTESEVILEMEQQEETESETSSIVKEYFLPVISITTENQQAIVEKDTKIPGTFSLEYKGNMEHPNIESASMTIKGRGHSTWELQKKPYKIKFDEKQSLFGLTAAKEWVLLANHADKSLVRNKLAMDIGTILNHVAFSPHAYNVDVMINGEYMGVYTLLEQIEVKEGRVPGETDGVEVDTDYLLEIGGEAEETSFGTNMFHSLLCFYVEIKNPDSDVLTEEQYEYVGNYLVTVDSAVKSLDGYEQYLDVPSVIDWFLLNELSYNIDGTFRRSTYLLKEKGGKMRIATYWDYDYAFGNFWRDVEPYDEWICHGNEMTVEDEYIRENWMTYLLQDPAFCSQLKTRWNEVKDEIYHTAMATIEDAQRNVSPSAERNFARWTGVLGKKIQYENSNCAYISTYEGQLEYLRAFVNKRYEWMDREIGAM